LNLTPEEASQVAAEILNQLQQKTSVESGPPAGKIDPRPAWQRVPLPAKVYKGEVMLNTAGKPQVPFVISKRCPVRLPSGQTCGQQLMVTRLKNIRFLVSDDHMGGQLDYDSDDTKLIEFCPQCTPTFPQFWNSEGEFIERPEITGTNREAPPRQGP
jgi:hypothetical protein